MGDVNSQWSVAWICSFINFLLFGVARLSGLLYLVAIGRYNADRSRASMPFVLCFTVRSLTGPLIGYLSRRVEIRLLIASGCFLSALGAGACFFAEDITTVSVLWGGVFGIGFGLGSILVPEVLNQHFDKYISNANGIALGGECVAGFVLPVFMEFLLDTYGASGTFLIMSGVILHGVPAALLLKPPSKASHGGKVIQTGQNRDGGQYSTVTCMPDEDNICDDISNTHSVKNSPSCNFVDYQKVETGSSDSANPKQISPEKHPSDQFSFHFNSLSNCSAIISSCIQSNEESSNHLQGFQSVVHPTTDHNHSYTLVKPHAYSITNSSSAPRTESTNKSKKSLGHNNLEVSANHYHSNSSVETYVHSVTNSGSVQRTKPTNQSTEFPGHTSPFWVFLDPAFILILFTQSSMIFIFTTIFTIIVDFSRDAGVLTHQEVYILMCLSIADILGRFGLGWVTDAQYMSNVSFSALCYAGSGLVMVALVFLRGFVMVLVVAFFIGLFLGGLLIVCPGIIMDHMEKEEVTMALASRSLLYAPMSLTQSLLIGFFREKLGSYDGLFYVLAVHCFICCTFSLFVPLASKYRDSRKEAK